MKGRTVRRQQQCDEKERHQPPLHPVVLACGWVSNARQTTGEWKRSVLCRALRVRCVSVCRSVWCWWSPLSTVSAATRSFGRREATGDELVGNCRHTSS